VSDIYERVTCLVAYKNVEVRIVRGFMRTKISDFELYLPLEVI